MRCLRKLVQQGDVRVPAVCAKAMAVVPRRAQQPVSRGARVQGVFHDVKRLLVEAGGTCSGNTCSTATSVEDRRCNDVKGIPS